MKKFAIILLPFIASASYAALPPVQTGQVMIVAKTNLDQQHPVEASIKFDEYTEARTIPVMNKGDSDTKHFDSLYTPKLLIPTIHVWSDVPFQGQVNFTGNCGKFNPAPYSGGHWYEWNSPMVNNAPKGYWDFSVTEKSKNNYEINCTYSNAN